MNDSIIQLFSLLTIIVVISSCDSSPQKRFYQEITSQPVMQPKIFQDPHARLSMQIPQDMMQSNDPQIQKALADSIAVVSLKWSTPKGWNEQKGHGMRMATFTSQNGDSITCTIVSLSGMAGGLKGNVVRWLRQINLESIRGQQLQEFLSQQKTIVSDGGIAVKIIDFTSLQESTNPLTPSMISAIATIADKTVFLKMTGSKKTLLNNRDKFLSLCQSLAQGS